MKRSDLYKYPRNILIPLALFIIVIGVVLVLYRFNSLDQSDTSPTKTPLTYPINTKSEFNITAKIEFDPIETNSPQLPLTGSVELNIDIASGAIIVENMILNTKVDSFKLNNIKLEDIRINLNPSYKSIGNLDMNKGEMDISLNTTVQFKFIENKEQKHFKSDLAIPLKGLMDKKTGIISLKGEATLPPDQILKPMPLTVTVIANTIEHTNKSISKKGEL